MKTRLIAILAVSATVALAGGCSKKDEPAESDDRAHAPEVDGLWRQIDAEHAHVMTLVNAGMLGEVHQHAFAIRGLVATLPRTAPRMRLDQSARLAGMAQTVAAQAEEMGTAADAGDADATHRCLATLDASLQELRTISAGRK